MEIIKKGINQKGWSKKFKCTGARNGGGGCKAILLVSEHDLYTTYEPGGYCENGDECITFKCSCCGVESDVRVPSSVSERIREREEEKERLSLILSEK